MSFRTASAILRGRWLLDKAWASAQMPLIVSAIKGGDFEGLFGVKSEEKDEEKTEARKVLSNRAGVVYSVNYFTDLNRIPEGSIAMLNITGPITKYGDICAFGSVDHVATMSRLSKASNVRGIILNIDSPGGEAAGTAMLADAIREAGKTKPVVAFIDDGIAASAAMWIASATQEIYVSQKTDMVGSIGVYTTIADWYGYFAAEGLNVRDIYAPQSSEKNLDYREALEGNDEPIKEDLKVLAQEFIDTVRRNRAGRISGSEWAKGKMYHAKDALKIGLIDGVKSLDAVVKRVDSLIKIKEQSNSNNMAFEKTLIAAKAESLEVVEGGFLMEEAHLNNIEASLVASEAAVANQSLQAQQAVSGQQAAEASLVTANATIAERDQTISTQAARITELESGAAREMTTTTKEGDDLGDKKGGVVSEVTKEANKLRQMKGLAPI